jgi:glycosyltransferase involved in cell wall biosynthesis
MISVCICTYNRCELLRQALESLAQVDFPRDEFEVLVVDNNSPDRTRQVCEELGARFRNFRYIFEPRQGQTFARNTGISNSRGPLICFVDDDTTLDPGYLRAVADAFERHPDCAGVAGRVEPVWSHPQPKWLSLTGECAMPGPLVYCNLGESEGPASGSWSGAAMSVRAEAFTRHGMFRTDVGRRGSDTGIGDDTELYERLVSAGELVIYSPAALVHHPVDPQRLTKKYFRSWARSGGEHAARTEGAPGRRLFGAPLWLWRRWAHNMARWFTSIGTKRRVYFSFCAYYQLGRIQCIRKAGRSGEGQNHLLTSKTKTCQAP